MYFNTTKSQKLKTVIKKKMKMMMMMMSKRINIGIVIGDNNRIFGLRWYLPMIKEKHVGINIIAYLVRIVMILKNMMHLIN